ncbi:MAG: WYL domain-containing transcriptional regulator [Chloroflexi bacterium]|nr:WYL domain-containing transcriptional regulator [Chloroflexota bacterium]
MGDRLSKTERIMTLWVLLHNNPLRYTCRELAEKFSVTPRTMYRDIDTLQTDLKVPVYDDEGKWALEESYHLPPVRFSVPEALTIFLSARLMLSYCHRHDPNAETAFVKLSSVVPPPLKEQVQKTIDWMQGLPRDDGHFKILSALAEAWISRRRIKITYRSLPAETAVERKIEPYFIEPVAKGHASYVIAYCHQAKALRVFKIERIEGMELTQEKYNIPSDFDANAYLGSSWGIIVGDEVKTIRLRLSPEVTRFMEETVWHPSQKLDRKDDGSAVMTLEITDTVEFRSWVLGWGDRVEVLAPPELRRAIIETVEATREVYRKRPRHK